MDFQWPELNYSIVGAENQDFSGAAMASFFKQPMGLVKSAKAIFFAAISVAPFLANQMGYEGAFSRMGTLREYPLFVAGYFSALNVVDQLLSAKYMKSYQNMTPETRRKWKVMLMVSSVIAVVSIDELIMIMRQTGN